MTPNIFQILERDYIYKIFNKKKEIYFPSLKHKRILNIEIEKKSFDWIKESCLARFKITFSDYSKKYIRGTSHINGSKKRAFQIAKYLYFRGFDSGDFRLPRPLDYIEETKVFFYEESPGTPLNLLLEKGGVNPSVFENLGKFLFYLHSTKGLNFRVKLFKLGEYKKIFKQIQEILPSFSIYIPPLKKIIFLKNLQRGQNFLHGDLYPSNIIVKGTKITILDFDKGGRGCFLVDLLPLIFWFELPKIKPLKLEKEEIQELQEALLKTYCRVSGLNFLKIKDELNKFKLKIFLDCLHHVTILAYYGWKEFDEKLKREFRESIKTLLEAINNCF